MKFRKLGKSGIDASAVAFGAWAIGGWMWGGADEKEAIDAIHAAQDNDINFIDTAPVYGFGRSEEIVGKAIKDRRDKFILATKCGMVWDKEKGDFFFYSDEKGAVDDSSKTKVYKYLGPESIKEEVEKSLKRLQTDYIDIYQTHWQDSTTVIEDTMSMLLKLKDEGKIRAIGASNAGVDQLEKYSAAGQLDSDQERFNMFNRDKEKDGNLNYCFENDVALLAYSPIAQGLLTGKITPDREFEEGDVRKNNPLFTEDNIKKVNSMLKEFKPIAEKYDASLVQLAIAWTLEVKGITHVLCGARNPEQVKENAGGGNIDLSSEDFNVINNIYQKYFG